MVEFHILNSMFQITKAFTRLDYLFYIFDLQTLQISFIRLLHDNKHNIIVTIVEHFLAKFL